MFQSIDHGFLVFLFVAGLVVLRLLFWPSPLTDKHMIRYLPKSLQRWPRWLWDTPRSSDKK
jgi:hypothetical protein